jgi:hypothetical protein
MTKRKKQKTRFAICMTDSEPDLELRKIYKILPDARAAEKTTYALLMNPARITCTQQAILYSLKRRQQKNVPFCSPLDFF